MNYLSGIGRFRLRVAIISQLSEGGVAVIPNGITE
jgi:hypothetical protein